MSVEEITDSISQVKLEEEIELPEEIKEYLKKIKPEIKKIVSRINKDIDPNDKDILDDESEFTMKMKIEELKRKQKTMKYGEIWQVAIGNFPGWEDLGIGHETECDLRRLDNTAIVELKNKYNTCNSGSKKDLERKLTNYKKKNPNTECIWGIINEKNGNKCHKKIYNVNDESIIKWQGRDFLKYCLTHEGIDYTEIVIKTLKGILYN